MMTNFKTTAGNPDARVNGKPSTRQNGKVSESNITLPINEWTPVSAPIENPPGQYVFTGAPATNAQTYYMLRSP